MLNIARLLSKVDSVPTDHRATFPTWATCENISRSAVNPRLARVRPTCPTWATEKTIHANTQDAGAEVPLSFDPLPGRYWLDPVENGFLPSSKTMTELSECRGYPDACQRCRLLMADLETCLLGPEGGTA